MTTTEHTRMNIDRFVSSYGSEWRAGVITEHLALLPYDNVRLLASGTPVVVNADGTAYPVLCSELVEIATEDGIITGRCGERVHGDAFGCAGHEALISTPVHRHLRQHNVVLGIETA